MIWFLVEKVKLNIQERNKKGQTALEVAKQKGFEEAVTLMEEAVKRDDKTDDIAQDLMAELEEEEKKK